MLHIAIIAVAALLHALYIYLSGYMTASPGEALWHYAAGAAGLHALYNSVCRLTERRTSALGAAVVWAVSPATMGVNAMAGFQGPLMALSAICINVIIRIRSYKLHPALTVITGGVTGMGLSIVAICLTDQPYLPHDLQSNLKDAVTTLLYWRSAERPGWPGDLFGAYISVPWLIIAWIYAAYVWRLAALWRVRRNDAVTTGALWVMGVLGAPCASIGVAVVLATGMLSGRMETGTSFFTRPRAMWICMGMIAAWGLALALTGSPIWCGDTPSYYSAAEQLAAGGIDIYRTPLYPSLLLAMMRLFGSGAEWATVVMQFLGLWVSAILLYRMLQLIWSKRTGSQAAFWVTLLYGVGNPTASMCLVICTEPLATALTVGCAYAMTMLWKRGFTLRRTAMLCGCLTAAVALRPAMMYMIIAVGIFGAVALWKRRRTTAAGAGCSVLATTVLLLAYCAVMHRQTGLFTPSLVGTVNRYADMAYTNPDLDSVTTRYPAVLADVKATGYNNDETMNIWTSAMYIERHGTQAVSGFISDVETTCSSRIRAEKACRLAAQYDLRPTMVKNSLMTYMSASLLTVPFSIVIMVIALWPFFAMIRNRGIRIIPTLLYITVLGNLTAVIIGAPDATPRLLSPSSSLLLFLGADLLLSIIPSPLKGSGGLVDSGKMRTFAE